MPLLQSLKPKTAAPEATQAVSPSVFPARRKRRAAKGIGPLSADLLFNRPWCIRRDRLEALVAEYVNGMVNAGPFDDDCDPDDEDCPYSMTADGIACIPVEGALMSARSWRGTAYSQVCKMAEHAYANPNVKAVLFCYDSPGGTFSGMNECSDYLYSMRDQKPTAAISDDQCYSAAYCLASSAPRLFVNKYSGGAGSIGVWNAHVDLSEMDKQMGVKVTYIYAGEKKVDGNPHEPLSDRAQQDMQEECDACRDHFVAAVARNRGVSAEDLYATEAGIYMRDEACPLLADQTGTMDDARNYLRGQMAAKAAEQQQMSGSTTGASASAANDVSEFVAFREELTDRIFAAFGIPRGTSGLQSGPIAPHKTASTEEPAELKSEAQAEAEKVLALGAPGLRSIREMFEAAAGPSSAHWCDVFELAPTGSDEKGFQTVERGSILSLRCSPQRASIATSGNDRVIRCCVAPYNKLSADLGGFREIYAPGCFAESLANGDDARALFNHDPNFVLGRRSANTVQFYERPDGLYFECQAPETSWANDLLVSMRRGDVDGGSAAFFMINPKWEYRDGGKVRVIEKARLVEASIASFPIYEATKSTVTPAATAAEAATVEPNDFDRARLQLLRLR